MFVFVLMCAHLFPSRHLYNWDNLLEIYYYLLLILYDLLLTYLKFIINFILFINLFENLLFIIGTIYLKLILS